MNTTDRAKNRKKSCLALGTVDKTLSYSSEINASEGFSVLGKKTVICPHGSTLPIHLGATTRFKF
jgi:hypothetical protein